MCSKLTGCRCAVQVLLCANPLGEAKDTGDGTGSFDRALQNVRCTAAQQLVAWLVRDGHHV
jgi:hypothetical protein